MTKFLIHSVKTSWLPNADGQGTALGPTCAHFLHRIPRRDANPRHVIPGARHQSPSRVMPFLSR